MDKKRSQHRLSSLFSLNSSSVNLPDAESGSVTSSTSSGVRSGNRLTKVKQRISSATHLSPSYPPPPPPPPPAKYVHSLPTIQPVESASAAFADLEPPPAISDLPRSELPSRPYSRSGSRPGSRADSLPPSRPGSAGLTVPGTEDSRLKKLRRKSGLFGSGSHSSHESVNSTSGSVGQDGRRPLAWIAGHAGQVPYNLTMLLNGEKVPELWDDEGDTLIHLFPRTADKGPSFRVDSSIYAASQYMTRLVHGRLYSDTGMAPYSVADRARRNMSDDFPTPASEMTDFTYPEGSSDGSKGSRAMSDATEDDHSEKHMYLPIRLSTDSPPVTPSPQEPRLTSKDMDTLITYRNFVAFLMGQSLVATDRHSDIFDIFMRIGDILQHYQFTNLDGSSYGEVAASSFDAYVDELHLADVRTSREKTIEAIVLGEHMRSMSLYTEGFVHAAGKFDNIREMRHPKFDLISQKTATRLARASMDLEIRLKNTNVKLENFDFPALFSGIMNSDTALESKLIKFKNWRSSFMSCRSFALDYYKSKYGSWLPKAKSKKNNFTTSGLNRLLMIDLYNDFSDLYDLLVDRTNLTTRTADGFMDDDESDTFEAVIYRGMRKILSEYDRSTPPVQPPIPFDLPKYPSPKGAKGFDYPSGDAKKDAKMRAKKIKSDDLSRMLRESHNADASARQTPFLDAFLRFESKQAHGSTTDELWDQRSGQWMFVYAVIQSLPMLVVDAPGVRFSDNVEYFLCQPPRSGIPWGREDTTRSRTWFGVAGGSQVVSLPTDIVEHGVEGVFRRSHAWKMAERWSQNDTMLSAAVQESIHPSPLPPPPGMAQLDRSETADRSRSNSPSRDRRRESVMNLGLEALPMPAGVGPMGVGGMMGGHAHGGSVGGGLAVRPASGGNDPSKTFDAILSSVERQEDGGKKDKKGEKKKKW